MKISIVTINLNNAIGLARTIQSVKEQTYRNIEYIVIDGGSSDESLQVIHQHLNHLNFWISETDHGIYHAMNKGIRNSNGDYLLFLNSGDVLYDKDVIEKVAGSLLSDIVFGNLIFSGSKKELYVYPDQPDLIFLVSQGLGHPATFYRREIFEHVGYYREDFKIISDWLFNFLAIFSHRSTYTHINVTVAVFNTDGISKNNQYRDLLEWEKKNALLEYYPLLYPVVNNYISIKNKLDRIMGSHLIKPLIKFIKFYDRLIGRKNVFN